MKRFVYRFRPIAVFVAILTLAFQGNAWAKNNKFERIFIFGDSLSDTGNLFALTGETTQPPWPLIPDRPYDIGGYQFSDGHVWSQRFARHNQLNSSGKAALADPGKNGNYAIGGARVRTGPGDPISASSQLAIYVATQGNIASADDLYVIQFGGNDLRDALLDPDPFGVVDSAVEAEKNIITQLYNFGARRFLVANVPDLGLTPAIRLVGAEGPASGLSMYYNYRLETRLQALENDPNFPDISITRLDLYGIVNQVVANPGIFGIENTTATCLMFLPPATDICDEPKRYVFWDGIHPTKTIHKIVAEHAVGLFD